MPDNFVDPGFVDSGFVDTITTNVSLLPPTIGQHWTDFREYRRGRFPSDWTPYFTAAPEIRVEGNFIDLADKNYIRLEGPNARTALVWKAPLNDVGLSNQEERFRFRLMSQAADRGIGALRVSGTVGLENYYQLKVGIVTGITISKAVNGVASDLILQSPVSPLKLGCFYNAVFRTSGTTLSAKIWADGLPEPVSWTLTTTDASLSVGGPGLFYALSSEITEIHYFSVGTNGLSAPSESDKDEPLRSWIFEPDEMVETTMRVEYYNPTTNLVEESWFSTSPRTTGPNDYPPNTVMWQLGDGGIIASKLEADVYLSGAALPTRNSIKIPNIATTPNSSGLFSSWTKYSFYGRPIEIRLNKVWKVKPGVSLSYVEGVRNLHRRSEIVGFGVLQQEPEVNSDEVVLQLGPPTSLLTEEIPVKRNIGISTGVKSLTNTGYLSIPTNANYNITEFVIYIRLFVPTTGITGTSYGVVSRRYHTATTRNQWEFPLFHASWATITDRHKMIFRANDNAGGTLFSSLTSPALNTGEFHYIIGGIGQGVWWFNVDGKHIDGGALGGVVNIGDREIEVSRVLATCIFCDHRVEKYVDENTAVSRFSTRREIDNLTISMHRCDDNTGNTVTDYATIANHGTLQGTNNVDRSWSPTYLGSTEIVGVPMPMTGGVLFHGPLQNIDPVRNIHRYNDRVRLTGTVLQMRVRGALLTSGTDYVEALDGPGTGYILTPSDQPVTFGLPQDAIPTQSTNTHIAQLTSDTLIKRGVVDRSTMDYESFVGLRKVMPLRGGFNYQQPPQVGKFLDDTMMSIAGFHTLDHDARIAVGSMLPTVNPDPFNRLVNLLEFTGLPNGGVTIADTDGRYALTNSSGDFGVLAYFKLTRSITPDLSVSTTGGGSDYSQPGYTIIDKMAGGTTGYYLGLDVDTGALRFAAGGIDFGGGKHYTTVGDYNRWVPGIWYAVSAVVSSGSCWLEVQYTDLPEPGVDFFVVPVIAATRFIGSVTGTLTSSTGIPLRIGHGPMGGFVGSICYAIGCSPAQDPPSYSPLMSLPINTFGTDRFWFNLNDGRLTDGAYEQIQSTYGVVHGARWCPSVVIDLKRSHANTRLMNVRTPVPALRIDVPYSINLQTLVHADIAAGVATNTRLALTTPEITNPQSTNIDSNNYAGGRQVKLEKTMLYDQVGSQAVADLLSYRLSLRHRYAEIRDMNRSLLSTNIGDEIVVFDYHPDFVAGRALRLISINGKTLSLTCDAGLWG